MATERQYLKQPYGNWLIYQVAGVSLATPTRVDAYPTLDSKYSFDTDGNHLVSIDPEEPVVFQLKNPLNGALINFTTLGFTGAHPPVGH